MSGSGRRLAGAAALAALVLTGCSAPAERVRAEPTATAPAPTTAPGDADAQLPAAPPSPTDDAASRQAALDAATAVLTAFARPDLDAGRWWAELAPLLSPAAAEAYAGTDPQLVPASAVTGPPRSTPTVSPYLSTVLVPTDAGEYAVLLVREGGGAPWLVERITPMATTGPSGALPPSPDTPSPPAEPAP